MHHCFLVKNRFVYVMNGELDEVFYSACALLGKSYFVSARYKSYAGLKAGVSLSNEVLHATASKEFAFVPREVKLGLALSLLSKLFKKRVDPKLLRPYQEFMASRQAAELSDALRGARGRKRKGTHMGENHDLHGLRDSLLVEYANVLSGVKKPRVVWSKRKSKRKLGWFDDAFHEIVINKALDHAPRFVVEFVLYHELLHAKHEVRYSRGKSLRRRVHTREFNDDERAFPREKEAEAWIQSNWNRILRKR